MTSLGSKVAQEKEDALQSSFLESIKDWNLIEIPSDGNCLYYALAWLLWGKFDRTLAQRVRNSLANFMAANLDLWKGYLSDGPETQQAYLKQLRKPGTWGDYLELSHFEILHKVHLKVLAPTVSYNSDPDRDTPTRHIVWVANISCPPSRRGAPNPPLLRH